MCQKSHDNTRLKYVREAEKLKEDRLVLLEIHRSQASMAYPQYAQMEPTGTEASLLPTPGDPTYQPTSGAAYPPPGYEQQQQGV